MKLTKDGWKAFGDWIVAKEAEYARQTGEDEKEARRNTREMVRTAKRQEPRRWHGAIPIWLKEWDKTLTGVERMHYGDPEPED